MSTTVICDIDGWPKATVTRDDDLNLTAVIEVEGLEPTRTTTAEERAAGISSLDPPTVSARARSNRADTLRNLINAAMRAVSTSAYLTLGVEWKPAELVRCDIRVATALKGALRMLEDPAEDV